MKLVLLFACIVVEASSVIIVVDDQGRVHEITKEALIQLKDYIKVELNSSSYLMERLYFSS